MTTKHKLKLWKGGLRFSYWVLCSPDSNNILDTKYSYLWYLVTCAECRKLGGRK